MPRRWAPWAAATALFALVGTSFLVPADAAWAADGDVTVTKTTNVTDVTPGQTFSYQIAVSCSSVTLGCPGATLVDPVPGQFELLSYATSLQHQATPNPIQGQTLSLVFTQPTLSDPGLAAGTAGVVTVQVRMRTDLPYEQNEVPIPNTATTDATSQTSGPLTSTATVTPHIPLELVSTSDKTITPESALAAPGAEVTASLTGGNDSNAEVDRIVITDPADPTADPNPFALLGFTGFGTLSFPAPADQVQVDAYVDPTGWVTGSPAAAPALPAGVAPEDVLGLRFTFTNSAGETIPPGTEAGVDLDLAQTDEAASLGGSTTVTNTASTVVGLDTDESDPVTSQDTIQLVPEDIQLNAGKSYSPDQVPAGGESTATLTAGNDSAFPLTSLTITEPSRTGPNPHADGFPDGVSFDGFSGTVGWPTGATGATVTYYYGDPPSTASETIPFGQGDPVPPPTQAGEVVRFEITFTGLIQPDATASVPFDVDTDPDIAGFPESFPNEVTVSGVGPGGGEVAITADDVLDVFGRRLAGTAGKTIEPGQIPNAAGEWVIMTLNGGVADFPEATTPADTVVVQDPPDPTAGSAWWDAFDPTAIADTSVPAGSQLTIDYWDGTDWVRLAPTPPDTITGPTTFSMDIPEDIQGDIQGLRFTFTAVPPPDDPGFDPGSDEFEPHVVAELTDPIPEPFPPGTSIQNCTATTASTPGVPDGVSPPACDTVELTPGDPGDADVVDKTFLTPADHVVTARSQEEATAQLDWSTGGFAGVAEMTIQDVPTPGAGTFYDAFDLVSIPPITTGDGGLDPHLLYDQVVAEYFDRFTNSWQRFDNDSCVLTCVGGFPGVTLTSDEQEAAIAVRLRFSESPARVGPTIDDPTAPPVGSGVARSTGNDRAVPLTFRLRDLIRPAGSAPAASATDPVLGSVTYNDPTGAGWVLDEASGSGVDSGGTEFLDGIDDDHLQIVDAPLAVSLDKVWSGGPLGVPPVIAAPENFPTSRLSLTARNDTAAKVDTLTITEPVVSAAPTPCTVNPFTYFDLVGFVSVQPPAGSTSGTLTLWHDVDGDGVRDPAADETVDADGATGLGEEALADVVGYVFAYAGRIDAGAITSVVSDLRLRVYERGSTTDRADQDDSAVCNAAEAQVGDLGGVPAEDEPVAVDFDDMELDDIGLAVEVSKTFSVTEQTEPDDGVVTMTLTGQPTGSARAGRLTITDVDASFWNAFDLVGLAPGFALTAPINRIQVDMLVDGATVSGPVQTQAQFLADPWSGQDPSDIEGLTFTFVQLDDGGDQVEQWENPSDPVQVVALQVQRRVELRDGSGEVPSDLPGNVAAPGETAPGLFTNTVEAEAFSFLGGGILSPEQQDNAQIEYLHARTAVEVQKGPADGSLLPPGQLIPYTLTVTNTGDWPLIDPVIVDHLPSDGTQSMLVFDPFAPVDDEGPYSYVLTGTPPPPPFGLPMPTDPDDVDAAAVLTGAEPSITFTFPPGTVLDVGQSYTITIEMVYRIGLPAGTQVENSFGVSGERPFDECGGDLVDVDGVEECQADTSVTVLRAGALHVDKQVRSDGDPALGVFSVLAGFDCTPDADGFYSPPCTPVTAPGDIGQWRLNVVNTGNVPMNQLVIIDELPRVGDSGVILDVPRDSAWTAGAIPGSTLVSGPPGATPSIQYTDDADPCVDALAPPSVCGTGWVDDFASLGPVTAVKWVIDLPIALQPNGTVTMQFATSTAAYSPTAGPRPIAWNTFAAGAALIVEDAEDPPPALEPVEGSKVGVAMALGSLGLVKTASGPGAAYAPDTFSLQLACTSDGEELPPIDVEVPLTTDPDDPQIVTVDELPLGAECRILEGDNGQVSSSGTTAIVGLDTDPLQIATLDNRYELTSLRLGKEVTADGRDQDGAEIAYGPFELSVVCEFLDEPVLATGFTASPMLVPIEDDDTVTLTGLPVGASCTISEEVTLGADPVTIEGATSDPAGAVSGDADGVTIVLTPDAIGPDPVTNIVDVTNHFGAGSLTVTKTETGDGAALYGGGPYTIHLRCVLDDGTGSRVVWEDDVSLGGAPGTSPWSVTVDDIAAGAVCTATEPDNGVADQTTISGDVTIAVGGTGTVTVTNTFLTADLSVTKAVTGDDTWADGQTFTVRLRCIDGDGGAGVVTIPGGAIRPIVDGETVVYEDLPVGAFCILDETDPGDSGSHVILDEADNPVGIFRVTDGVNRAFTVENAFATGSIHVAKTVTGAGAAFAGDFEVTLSCLAVIDGVEVDPIDIPGGATRTLSAPDELETTYESLPPGAVCVLEETGTGGASGVTITPAGATATVSDEVTVVADIELEITVANDFALGSVAVNKVIAGAGAVWATGDFDVTLDCTWDDGTGSAPLDLAARGIDPDRTLSAPSPLSASWTGLPVGAVCAVTETNDGNASSSTIAPASVTVGSGAAAVITVTNTFLVGSIRVEKTVVGGFGAGVSFPVQLSCTWNDGTDDVVIAGAAVPGGAVRTLSAPGYATVYDGLPNGAVCTLEELYSGGATSIVYDPVDATVTVAEGAQVTLGVTNTFDEGALTVTKERTGDGADDYGVTDSYVLHVRCELPTETTPRVVYDADLPMGGIWPLVRTVEPLPIGAECVVTEPDPGLADDATFFSPDAVSPGDPVSDTNPIVITSTTVDAAITVTNIYDAAIVTVQKVITGDGADLYGAGPFTVTLGCVDGNGGLHVVTVPDGATRVLAEDNTPVAWEAEWDALPVGALCRIRETGDGGATSSTITGPGVVAGVFRVGSADAVLQVTNLFALGSITVQKQVVGGTSDGPFEVQLQCTNDVNGVDTAVPIDDGIRTLSPTAGMSTVYADLPVGAECELRELADAGAYGVEITPNSGDPSVGTATVAIGDAVTITVVNDFDPLAGTGVDVRAASLVAGLLLLAGLVVTVVLRRRRAER